jgi:2-C-methyl-D-erythritol 4-phosphate cytidylyltransferase
VEAGLSKLDTCYWIVVHDGARPLVTGKLIEDGLKAAGETGTAVAAVPVTDTIKIAGEDMLVRETPDRNNLWAIQTPQVIRSDILRKAFRRVRTEVTDDASMVEQLGYRVKLFMGAYDNIKITAPDDLTLAGILWNRHER